MRAVGRGAASFVLLGVIVALAGCAGPYTAEQWRAVSRERSAIVAVYEENRRFGVTPEDLAAAYRAFPGYWDGSEPVTVVSPTAPAAVVYDIRPGNDRLTFDVFVASGAEGAGDERMPIRQPPSGIFTCYTLEVIFAPWGPDGFGGASAQVDDPKECPTALVQATTSGSRYEKPQEFRG